MHNTGWLASTVLAIRGFRAASFVTRYLEKVARCASAGTSRKDYVWAITQSCHYNLRSQSGSRSSNTDNLQEIAKASLRTNCALRATVTD